jgi:hypothetical protein
MRAVVGEARYSSLQNSMKHVSMQSEVNRTQKRNEKNMEIKKEKRK